MGGPVTLGKVRFLIVLALLFTVTPGMIELAEAAAHIVDHGDLPHVGADHESGCAEHTCTPLAHNCGCHATMSALAVSRSVHTLKLDELASVDRGSPDMVFGRACEPPPLRPPIR